MTAFNKVLIVFFLFVSIPIWMPWGLGLFGLYIDRAGWEVAQIAAERRNVHLCKGIFTTPWNIFNTTSVMRADCIHDYARLTKDPSACELLMPSSYGLSCVGGAENHQLPCNTDVKENSVFWTENDVEHLLSVDQCALADATRSTLGDQCCKVAKTAFLQEENSCSDLADNPKIHDRCLYSLALKLNNPESCQDIQNENARAACLVRTGHKATK
jgi:hypothetical protein